MAKHFHRRIWALWLALEGEMKRSSPSIAMYGIPLGLLVVIIIYLVTVITGDVIGNLARDFWNSLKPAVSLIIYFAKNNLATTAVILLCVWIFILITHAYFETRPPHKINVGKEILRFTFGNYVHTGFLLTNNRGEDLHNCKIYISQIDDKKQYRDSNRDYLYWGEALSMGTQKDSIDIPNTESGSVYFSQIGYNLKSTIGDDKFTGKHDLILIFTADSVGNRKVTMYIYCEIIAGVYIKTENLEERPRITLLKAET